MFEGISKNWGYLTTIGAIVVAAFGAGIWLKSSLDTLNTLPAQVVLMDGRLTPLEKFPEEIKRATCALEAKTEMAKNEVLMYTVGVKIDEIREQVTILEAQTGEWDGANRRRYERLGKKEQALNNQKREFQAKYDQQFEIYDDCK